MLLALLTMAYLVIGVFIYMLLDALCVVHYWHPFPFMFLWLPLLLVAIIQEAWMAAIELYKRNKQ